MIVERKTSKYFLKIENLIILLIGMFVVVISWLRLSYGIELTDEAFYIATMKQVADGGSPFFQVQTLNAGFTLPVFWLVPLFEMITGSMEGVVIFLRHVFLIIKVLSLLCVYLLLRQNFEKIHLSLFLIAIIPFTPANISMFSYNTVPLFFILLAGALITNVILRSDENTKRSLLFSAIAGMLMALAAFAHPPQVIVAIIMGVVFIVVAIRMKKNVRYATCFFLSGVSMAIVVLVILVFLSGGISVAIDNLSVFIDRVPTSPIPNSPKSTVIFSVFVWMNKYKVYYLLLLCFVIIRFVLAGSKHTPNTQERESHNSRWIILLWGVTAISIGYLALMLLMKADRYQTTLPQMECAIAFLPIALLAFLQGEHIKKGIAIITMFWLPSIAAYFCVSLSSKSGICGREYLFFIPAVTSILLLSEVFVGVLPFPQRVTPKAEMIARIVGKYSVIVLAVFLIIISSLASYSYVYRDGDEKNINLLDSKVGSGIYKGISTTKTNAEGLIKLEDEIKAYTKEGETVLFLDVAPFGYLMSDAAILAPYAWDAEGYTNGNNNDVRAKYYAELNEIPDKIIYVDFGRDDLLSIDSENFKFNIFVEEKYKLEYEDREAIFPIVVFERNNKGVAK